MASFTSTRELSKRPGKIIRRMSSEGPQVITQNDVPVAYLVPTSGKGIEADLDALRRLMLERALDAAQTNAVRSGVSEMSIDEIDAEIAIARKIRRT